MTDHADTIRRELESAARLMTGWTYKGDSPEPDPRRLMKDAAALLAERQQAIDVLREYAGLGEDKP